MAQFTSTVVINTRLTLIYAMLQECTHPSQNIPLLNIYMRPFQNLPLPSRIYLPFHYYLQCSQSLTAPPIIHPPPLLKIYMRPFQNIPSLPQYTPFKSSRWNPFGIYHFYMQPFRSLLLPPGIYPNYPIHYFAKKMQLNLVKKISFCNSCRAQNAE